MPRHTLVALGLAQALATLAHAEPAAQQPEIVVTASRTAETVDASLADVSVIERADIERSGAADLSDLLRLQPGVDIARTGGTGEQTSVFLRGSNANHVLVLVDGVRIASANTGGVDFSQWPLDAVERIEIVRGPRASYWGSDAIGGVIQIFTRRLDGAHLAVRYGSYGDAAGSAGYGAWDADGGYSVQVGARHVRGQSATNRSICSGPNDPYCIYDPDHDGYRNRNAVLQGATTLGGQRLSASVLRTDSDSEFDQGRSHTIEQATHVALEGDLAEGWHHSIALNHAREDLRTRDFFSLLLTRRTTLDWQNTFTLDAHQRFVAGLDLSHEKGESRDLSSGDAQYADKRDNSALFAGWHTNYGAWNTELAGRIDANSEFGRHGSGSAAAGVDLGDGWRLTGSYGTAFRGPNLNEQFSPGYSGYYAGNPDLDPETSRSAEIGLEWRIDPGQRAGLRIYQTRIHDLISFTGPQNRAENIAKAKIDGAELSWDLDAAPWRLRTAYTWEDPRNESNDKLLLRRARQKFTSDLTRQLSQALDAGVEVLASGRRADYGVDGLPGYALVNLHASWQFAPGMRLTARAENLTDRDYALVHGFNVPGRSAWLEFAWEPR